MNLTAKELYEKKKMHLAVFGLVIAFIAAAANTTFQNFNVAATGIISESFVDTLLAAYVLSVLALGLCEILGGILMTIFNIARGIPLAEYGRIMKVKSSWGVLIASVVSSPIATACAVMGIAMCGSTYANCIIGLTPAVTAIMGVFILKEKISKRAGTGIFICVAGALLATMSPPEGITNFYLGIILACICPIAYSIENMLSAHALDTVDPAIACPLFRMIGSGIICIIVVLVVCVVTGNLAWIGLAFSIMGSSSMCLLFLFCTGLFMAIQYNGTYNSYTTCGAAKGAAILWTGTFWTIPIGFTMAALNILDYNVTGMGIVAAIVVVIGIMLVVAKPKELFSLRSN